MPSFFLLTATTTTAPFLVVVVVVSYFTLVVGRVSSVGRSVGRSAVGAQAHTVLRGGREGGRSIERGGDSSRPCPLGQITVIITVIISI